MQFKIIEIYATVPVPVQHLNAVQLFLSLKTKNPCSSSHTQKKKTPSTDDVKKKSSLLPRIVVASRWSSMTAIDVH